MPYDRPIDALNAYQDAHRREDIGAVVGLIDFEQEAFEKIGNSGFLSAGQIDEEVTTFAENLRSQYQGHLRSSGFGRPIDIGSCKIVSCLDRNENLARFTMTDGSNFWPQRVVKRGNDWRILRG
jgi:hypothetical protein